MSMNVNAINTNAITCLRLTCVLPYFCRSSRGGSKVKPEIAPIEARSVADRGSLQLYVFYRTFGAYDLRLRKAERQKYGKTHTK